MKQSTATLTATDNSLLIRKDTEADLPAIAALLSNADVFPLLGTPPYCTPAQLAAVFGARSRDDLGLACWSGQNLLGYGQLSRVSPSTRRSHAFTMMVAVHTDARKKGVASALVQSLLAYADKWTPCTRVEIVVETTNAAAIALYEKFGFLREGTHKNYVLTDGEMRDVIAMARIRNP